MTNMENTGIAVKNVTKRFGSVTALDGVSLEFGFGKIYGLLGRNGAGKSTLLNIISNRLFPDGGEVTINGMPAAENDRAQSAVYMVGDGKLLPDTMRVSEAFLWTGRFYGAFDGEKAKRLCEAFGLNPKKRLRALSTGYYTIFRLICALCVNAPYVLIDEPANGLDANNRDLFYAELVKSFAESPRTFVISTHLIDEIAGILEHVVIINEGKIIENESCEALLSSGYTVSGPAAAVDAYAWGKNVIGEDALGGMKAVYILGSSEPGKSELSPEGENIAFSKLDLQKLFIKLTNRKEGN